MNILNKFMGFFKKKKIGETKKELNTSIESPYDVRVKDVKIKKIIIQ